MYVEEWKKSMERIGINVASIYGATYLDCEILDNGNVRFYCDECGDKFYCDVKPSDLKEYDY